jgi:hypothetical protein
MKRITRHLTATAVIAISVVAVTAVRADDDGFFGRQNAYVVNPLVSDQTGQAPIIGASGRSPAKKLSMGQVASPSSWKMPCIAAWMV